MLKSARYSTSCSRLIQEYILFRHRKPRLACMATTFRIFVLYDNKYGEFPFKGLEQSLVFLLYLNFFCLNPFFLRSCTSMQPIMRDAFQFIYHLYTKSLKNGRRKCRFLWPCIPAGNVFLKWLMKKKEKINCWGTEKLLYVVVIPYRETDFF